ncbi:MAG: DUF4062 domain-containing protein [Bacteroidetes bacterium]|nr:DUF4062 domain-containing protein [Bacteroidota bacterium]
MSNIQKRYQVFVSSTYEDLKEERMEVLHALLELDCIPCGMEYFPASSESQWKYITQLIDNCDYYMVIVGNRYGSEAEDGKSYTQKEFEYAVEKGIPVIGFLHNDPTSISVKKSETDAVKLEKLKEFRKAIQKRLCKYWKNSSDLGGVVSRSLMQEIKHNPQIGWVRANELEKLPTNDEMVIIMKENKELKSKLDKLNAKDNAASSLADGNDEIELIFNYILFSYEKSKLRVFNKDAITVKCTWEDIFMAVASCCQSREYYRDNRLIDRYICGIALKHISNNSNYNLRINIAYPNVGRILQQLQALGLIMKEHFKWVITVKGENRYLKSIAIKQGQVHFNEPPKLPELNANRIVDFDKIKIGDLIIDDDGESF